jgi:DNA-binding response OmpR family regulator/signal transduction histidine kinase
MANPRDRILIVENDPVISDLIGRQALQAVGYQVQIATDATSAIARALQWAPDLIMVDLNLPGLSGKDLLVALASQGIQTPLIIIAERGMESDIVQAFRLGASDYLLLPLREAEIVNAVTRVLQQVHDRQARDRLAQQLQQANQELQLRVRELTTIFALGKAMTSVTDQSILLDKILDGAVRITQADLGWFLLREDTDKPFLVLAECNLPPSLGVRLNHPWDDGISSLVAMSGEVLAIHGEPLRRFKISALGLSALIVPIKVQKIVIGLLVMMRKQPVAFGTSDTHLLDALADYASISLVNARLFRALEERARSHQLMADTAQLTGKVNNDVLCRVKEEFTGPLSLSLSSLEEIIRDPTARLRTDQRQKLAVVQDQQIRLRQIAEAIKPLPLASPKMERMQVNITDLLAKSVRRFQPFVHNSGLTLISELPAEPINVYGDAALLSQAFEGLISAAINNSSAGAQIVVSVKKTADMQAYALLSAASDAIAAKIAEKIFDNSDDPPAASRFSGIGIRLCLAKEIIERHNGKVWLENKVRKGFEFHFRLPLAR